MTFGRRLVAAGACVPLLAALGACSEDEPEPKFAPSESPTPTETTTSEPAAWEEKSEDGAVAFVQHWIEALNQSGTDGDTEPLVALSSKNCDSCNNLIQYIEEVYGEGGSIDGAGWKVLEFGELAPGRSIQSPEVPVRVRQSRQIVHRADTDEPRHVPASTFTVTFALDWQQGNWRTANAVIVQ